MQVPYNFERLMLLFSDMNFALVDTLMKEFDQKGSLKIPQDLQMKVDMYSRIPFLHPLPPFLDKWTQLGATGDGNGIYIPHFLFTCSNAVYITSVQG